MDRLSVAPPFRTSVKELSHEQNSTNDAARTCEEPVREEEEGDARSEVAEREPRQTEQTPGEPHGAAAVASRHRPQHDT